MRGQSRIGILFIIASVLVIVGVSALSSVTVLDPTDGANLSGSITLNATTDTNATNVTFFFRYASNGTFAFNTTIVNDSANDTVFDDASFDTTVRPDGVYNITANATNGTATVTDVTVTNVTLDNTAPSVTLNTPQPGANLSNQTIELNATVADATAGVDAVLFEVLDGSGENVSGSLVSGDDWNASLDLSTVDEGLVTIRVLSNDTSGNMNDSENVTITVDRTAPNVVIATANDTNTTDTTPTISYTATDARSTVSCTVAVDGSTDAPAGNSTVLNATTTSADLSTLTEGTHTYNVTCTDASGNIGISSTNMITVDITAPIVSFDAPQQGANFSSETIDLNATVSDATTNVANVTFEVLNTTPFNETASESGGVWNFPLDLSAVAEGSLTIRIWAYDTAGNVNESETVSITIDRTAPNVTITSPTDGLNVSGGSEVLNATVIDTVSIDSVIFEIDDGTPQNITASDSGGGVWNATLNISNVTEGSVTIRVWANDTLGNTNSTQSVLITADSTQPVVTIESTPFNTTSTVPQIDFNVTDNIADSLRCELFMNGAPYGQTNVTNGTSSSIAVDTGLPDDSYEANVTCMDDADNVGVSGLIVVIVDTARPVVVLNDPSAGNYSDQTIMLNATATDALSGMSYVNFTISDGTPDVIAGERDGDDWNASLDLSTVDEGAVTIIVRAYDTAGNNNLTENVTILVDRTVPTVTINEPVQNSVVGSMSLNVTLNGTGTGINTSTILFTFENSTGNYSPNYGYANLSCVSSNAGEILDCLGTFSLDDDTYNIGFGVNDTSSNWGVASANNVTLNTALPTIDYDVSSTVAGTYAQDFIFINVTASVSAGSIDTIELYRYDDGSLTSTDTNDTSPHAINHTGLADGVYVVNGTVNDTAGNEGVLALRTYTLDTTAPIVAIDNESFNTTDDTPEVFVTASDATAITCELFFDATSYNTTSVSNETSTGILVNATIPEGAYTANVTCVDAVGNSGSDTINVTIDTTAPTITFANPDAGSSSNATNLTINTTVTGSPSSVTYRIVNSSNESDVIIGWAALTQNGDEYTQTINLSNLTEWNYTIQINTSDSLGNERVSNRTFLVDRTAPSATLTCNNVQEGAAQDCTCTVTDNSDAFGGSTNPSITPGDTSSTGDETATCTATDLSGLEATDSATYTVTSSSSPSGGGGGGSSFSAPDPSAKKTWLDIEAGTRIAITITNPNIAIRNISILVGNASSSASIEIEKLDLAPVRARFEAYQFYEIFVERFSDPTQRTFSFEVPRSWFADRNASASDVRLYRYAGGEWVALPTRIIGFSDSVHRYESTTPGFSYFAIGLLERQETVPDDRVGTEEPAPAPDAEPDAEQPEQETSAEPESIEEPVEPPSRPSMVLIIGSIVGSILLLVAAWFIFGRGRDDWPEPDKKKTQVFDEYLEHSKEHASEIDRMLGIGEDEAEENTAAKRTTRTKRSKPAKRTSAKKPKSSKGSSGSSKKPSKTSSKRKPSARANTSSAKKP